MVPEKYFVSNEPKAQQKINFPKINSILVQDQEIPRNSWIPEDGSTFSFQHYLYLKYQFQQRFEILSTRPYA